MLGDAGADELLALKRVAAVRGTTRATLAFVTPADPGTYVLTVQLVSDVYVGLGQELEIRVTVVPAPPDSAADGDAVAAGWESEGSC